MKALLQATAAYFLLGTSFAHDVTVVSTHTSIVEHRIVQLNAKIGAVCTTDYISVTTPDGSSKTRKSVDCEE